jgi:hypothetical protein
MPGLFLFPAQNPSHPPTPSREQKIISLAWGNTPRQREGGATQKNCEAERVAAAARLWGRGRWRRVSGQQRISGRRLQIGWSSSRASPEDPYDRDDDTRQIRGGAVFSPSPFGGHLLAGDCILALHFSLFHARVSCLVPGSRCWIWFLISSWPRSTRIISTRFAVGG